AASPRRHHAVGCASYAATSLIWPDGLVTGDERASRGNATSTTSRWRTSGRHARRTSSMPRSSSTPKSPYDARHPVRRGRRRVPPRSAGRRAGTRPARPTDHVLLGRSERRVSHADARGLVAQRRLDRWGWAGFRREGQPPVKFEAVFARARREGYRITMHCDVDQENSVEHIRQCLEEIEVEAITPRGEAWHLIVAESPELRVSDE